MTKTKNRMISILHWNRYPQAKARLESYGWTAIAFHSTERLEQQNSGFGRAPHSAAKSNRIRPKQPKPRTKNGLALLFERVKKKDEKRLGKMNDNETTCNGKHPQATCSKQWSLLTEPLQKPKRKNWRVLEPEKHEEGWMNRHAMASIHGLRVLKPQSILRPQWSVRQLEGIRALRQGWQAGTPNTHG